MPTPESRDTANPLSMNPSSTEHAPADFHDAVVTVINESGLHLRVAVRVVELARTLPAEIELQTDENRASAKSMLDLLSLAAMPGTSLRVVAHGPDAKNSLTAFLAGLSLEEFRIDRAPDLEESAS